MSEWKDISSAPKDKPIILGRSTEDDTGRPPVSTFGWWEQGYSDGPDEMGHDGGFVDYAFARFQPGRSFGNPAYMRTPVQPTHWMPLPPPPKGGE